MISLLIKSSIGIEMDAQEIRAVELKGKAKSLSFAHGDVFSWSLIL